MFLRVICVQVDSICDCVTMRIFNLYYTEVQNCAISDRPKSRAWQLLFISTCLYSYSLKQMYGMDVGKPVLF
jgi:hypothetical protein